MPAFVDQDIDWPDPYADEAYLDADWPNLESEWSEPPAIAEFDAQWEEEEEIAETRVYGRTAEFPPPSSVDSTAAMNAAG